MSSGRIFSRGGSALPIAATSDGAYIADSTGRRYLDAAGGAIVVGIGHGRRAVADAAAAQMAKIAYAHGSAFTAEALEAWASEVGPLLPMSDPSLTRSRADQRRRRPHSKWCAPTGSQRVSPIAPSW